jgi:hypothetical protein
MNIDREQGRATASSDEPPPLVLKLALNRKIELPPIPAGLEVTPLANSELLIVTFARDPEHPLDPLCRNLPSKIWTTLVAALLVMIVSRRDPLCLLSDHFELKMDLTGYSRPSPPRARQAQQAIFMQSLEAT